MCKLLTKFADTFLKGTKIQAQEIIPGIKYEVALEVLGDSMRPYVNARAVEEAKDKPNEDFIEYCNKIIQAIDMLRDSSDPNDTELIARIFAPADKIVGCIK